MRSVQLQWTRLTVFLPTTLYLERFWREFKLPLKSHKPVSRAYRTENGISYLSYDVQFYLFYIIYFERDLEGQELPCCGKSALKCILKINWT